MGRYKEITGSPAALPKPDNDVHFHVNLKSNVQSKTKQPLSESGSDYGNTFTIGKSFGTVRQNNFGGKNHISKIGQSGNDYGITNHGFVGGYGHDGKYKPVFECRSGEGVSLKDGFAMCKNGKKMKIDCLNIKMNQNKVYCCPQCPKVNIDPSISRPCYPFCDGGIPGLNEKIQI